MHIGPTVLLAGHYYPFLHSNSQISPTYFHFDPRILPLNSYYHRLNADSNTPTTACPQSHNMRLDGNCCWKLHVATPSMNIIFSPPLATIFEPNADLAFVRSLRSTPKRGPSASFHHGTFSPPVNAAFDYACIMCIVCQREEYKLSSNISPPSRPSQR